MAHTNFVSPIRKTAYQPLVWSEKNKNNNNNNFRNFSFQHFGILEIVRISLFHFQTLKYTILIITHVNNSKTHF